MLMKKRVSPSQVFVSEIVRSCDRVGHKHSRHRRTKDCRPLSNKSGGLVRLAEASTIRAVRSLLHLARKEYIQEIKVWRARMPSNKNALSDSPPVICSMEGDSLADRQTCRVCKGVRRRLGMTLECRVANGVVASCGAKKQRKGKKQQHINGTENILFDCSTTVVQITTRSHLASLTVVLHGIPYHWKISPGDLAVDGAERKVS
ncbi:hypothetical protein TNCV_85851 [Trichonephila clavipes]|nr:hypothetical protein TNCV_85851 [Trichonephila clavipes]